VVPSCPPLLMGDATLGLPRSCAYPGCPEVVTGAPRCPTHTVSNTQRTGSRARKVAAKMKAEQPWCSSCGSPGTAANPLTIDHIIPLSRGGTNARENKTVLCYRCNRLKSDAVGPSAPIQTTNDNTIVIA
jgi:5-methylcytosine-specific restriction enzyme A